MKLTLAQRYALTHATKTVDGSVFAGRNPGWHGVKIGANTIKSLAKAGYLTLGKTTQNETWGRITAAGLEALLRSGGVTE